MTPDDTPQTIGRYRLEKLIGTGSAGVVHLAVDKILMRRVAIKRLCLEKLKTDEERRIACQLFLQEARIIGNLSHPHITAVYDIGVDDGTPYMIMEFIDGRNLRDLMKEGVPFPVEEIASLTAMIARALHYAHRRGVLHRDIKPANIMIDDHRTPKITDFGIAMVMNAAASQRRTPTDRTEEVARTPGMARERPVDGEGIFGTPHYMSPEQIEGGEIDQRSDIFSLAVLAYEWLSGKKPFQAKFLVELFGKIRRDDPPSLAGVAGIEEELAGLIHLALAKDPASRFQNAGDFADALEIYIHRRDVARAGHEQKRSLLDKIKIMDRLRKSYLFFSDFTDSELLALLKMAGKEEYESGDCIIRQGTSGSKMYLILAGSVAVVNDSGGRSVELESISEGGCFGEMSIIDRMPRSASVIAREPTRLLSINETALRLSNPKLCLKLYRNLAMLISEKLRQSTAKLIELKTEQERL